MASSTIISISKSIGTSEKLVDNVILWDNLIFQNYELACTKVPEEGFSRQKIHFMNFSALFSPSYYHHNSKFSIMGYKNWSSNAFDNFKRSSKKKTRAEIFTSRGLHADMNPHGVHMREARDSANHPNSLGVMVWLDVTGSMGSIPEQMIRGTLGTQMETLIKHGVPDAAVFMGAIGDHHCDSSPLQVGQFESGTTELVDGLSKIYIEGGGGGQWRESYLLAWLFAARHTSMDCFEKRGKKGFLFTIGDEATWDSVDGETLRNLLGYQGSEDVTAKMLLDEARKSFYVYHIHINSTHYRDDPQVIGSWRDLLGEHLIILDDPNATAETIAAQVARVNGADLASIVSGFDPGKALSVTRALSNVSTRDVNANPHDDIIKF